MTDFPKNPTTWEDVEEKNGWLGPETKKQFNKRVRCIYRHMGNYTLEVIHEFYQTIQRGFYLRKKCKTPLTGQRKAGLKERLCWFWLILVCF